MALKDRTLGIIHAAVFTASTVEPYAKEIIGGDADALGRRHRPARQSEGGAGDDPKVNFFKFTTYALLEEAGCDMIMLACSTFNQAVAVARPMIGIPLLNIDRPMMDLAVQDGRRIGLLGTLPSTMPASERLLREAAADAGREIEVKPVLCAEAFRVLREENNPARHNELLLEEIDRLSREVDAIVMAQVSMSVLEKELANPRVPVYNSGRTSFQRVREMLLAMD